MTVRHGPGASRRLRVALVGVVAVGMALGATARAADSDRRDNALKLIPADASFYCSMLRNREQIERLTHSNAWKKLHELPLLQMGLQHLHAQLKQPSNPQLAMLLQLYQQPENQKLIEVLREMASDEVFLYGGENFVKFVELAQVAQSAARFGGAFQFPFGQFGGNVAPGDAQLKTALKALANNLDLVQIPDLVIGFKVKDMETAEAQIRRLKEPLEKLVEQVAQLKGHVEWGKGATQLQMTLEGSMLPRDEIAAKVKELEDQEGEFEPLVKKLTQLKLTISLGVRDHYVLLAFGPSNAAVTGLGSGQKLADRPEFAPLVKYADKPLTTIIYASAELRNRIGTNQKDIKDWLQLLKDYAKKGDLPAEQLDRLRKDLDELAKELRQFIPESGALVGFSFLTAHGGENYNYDYSESLRLVGSQPLGLLHHVGGSPLLTVVARHKQHMSGYEFAVKWLKKGYSYFEELALPKLDEAQKAQFEMVAKVVLPYLKKVDQINRTLLFPAFQGDGQFAFVLDGKITSKQWHERLPALDKPAAMLEPAVVYGISDAAKLRKACADYRAATNELIAKLREQIPFIPEFEIPPPETAKIKDGTLYFYTLPEVVGLDKQIVPNAGLSDHVAVVSLSKSHSERLLANTPLKVDEGPLAEANRPLGMAVYFDWAGLLTAATPWIDFGVQAGLAQRPKAEPPADQIMPQVHVVLDVLKCLRTYTSASYFEGKVLVTHGETVFKDL